MKFKYLIVLIFSAVVAGRFLFADEIKLKSGRVIEGEIVDETESTVKINIGYGIVGFSRSRIDEVIRSSDKEKEQLDEKLELQRKKAIKSAKDNERWYDKEEKRQDLLAKQRNRQRDIKLKREQILRKRKQQIAQMRKKRVEGMQAIQSGQNQIATSTPPPPPPPLPGAEPQLPSSKPQAVQTDTESSPKIPAVEPVPLEHQKPVERESQSRSFSSGRRTHHFRER